ncbi:hypothetical protein EX895_004316 [Sporisorium graminicola]|uniref:Uncharacterized protein n=1 Tax=Sporisorium graminicola TaxID=280036 RepID=A0A4U7KRN0_9BASI|nr:hypothetical protein EX895_004316 [Sporisorium graminicola]TKY86676.1 hypothetical protein EX895_004316 [Sporisorium graminicola]
MHFADLLRRSSPHATGASATSATTTNTQSPAASTSYHGAAASAPSSTSQPRSSRLSRERSLFSRSARSRPSLETDGDLLYPAHHTQPRSTSSRTSRYSSTDDHSIGHAPTHTPNLAAAASSAKTSLTAHSPAPSSIPPSTSSPDAAPSSTTTSTLNRYDRLFGPPTSSVPPRPSSVLQINPPPPPASTSTAPQLSRSASARKASEQAPLFRTSSIKARSPFPPAASSTGTSSTLRDRSTMGSAIFRRSSLRRGTGTANSSASHNEKAAPVPTPPLEPSPAPVPFAAAVSRSESVSTSAAANSTTNPGRLARFFGRRKSISNPHNVLNKPDLVADPVPVLQDASRTVNVDSPPLAVITAGWQQPPVATKASRGASGPSRPVSPRSVSPPKAPDTKLASPTQPNTVDSEISKVSSFTFPARASLSNDSPLQLSAATNALRPRQTKHSTSHSLPLTSLPISNPIPISVLQESVDTSAMPAPQRRPSRPGRSLSQTLGHRKSSKSLSMIGSFFGSGSRTDLFASSPPLPSSAADLAQRYPGAAENRASQTELTSNHSRKPSLRARLKIGRNATDQGSKRPTTPEIESWKQKISDPIVDGASAETRARSRASIDSPFRPKPAESPVKIVRSKSMVRRKPPPEIKQDEIDSSSSTPVYGRTFRALDVDRHTGSPLGGSPASSPEALFDTLTGAGARRGSSSSASRDAGMQRDHSGSSQLNSLGLTGASNANAQGADTSIPSIDIRPSTPSREASPQVATEQPVSTPSHPPQQQHKSTHAAKRLSSGMHSVTDTSMSLDRPWSLISASEADTPLLKLRKLVVDTEASDESRDGHNGNDLFFRPLAGATKDANVVDDKADVAETMADHAEKADATSQGDAERSSSQSTTRSDTKHEIASIPSSNASTVRAVRNVAAPPIPYGLSVVENSDRNVDSVGPLRAKSPSASQHSFRSRQHRRDGSVGSVHSQTTIQQARRSSTASRLTARSSGHWSESRLSEDALSALEAEVGQARRTEVVALGKGRVKDWVGGGGADRPLPMAEAPTLSRSNTLRSKAQKGADAGEDQEAQRQRRLNNQLDRRLQQLSEAQGQSADVEIRDIPDQVDPASIGTVNEGLSPAMQATQKASDDVPVLAPPAPQRLSAFHDRRAFEGLEQAGAQRVTHVAAAVAPAAAVTVASPSRLMTEEAIRLGRAPSKRVRRNVSETRSFGEAVMVEREYVGTTERESLRPAAVRPLRRSVSLSSKKKPSAVDYINPTLVPAVPSAPVLGAPKTATQPAAAAPVDTDADSDSKKHSKQRSYATSEEAARAKRLELLEREKRLAEKEARRQTQLQQKYALKKQSDPLLAARLALAGLEARETMPQVKVERATGAGLQAPAVPTRRASTHSPGRLSVTPAYAMRKDSNAGSTTSFHTALDAPVNEPAAVDGGAGDASSHSKGSAEVRPDTSYSIASSLAVDFEFPVPPQRMKEQLSDDGTLLSRAGLQQSPGGQQWRERRHFALANAQRVDTPRRDSSLRGRTDSASKASPHIASLFSAEYGVGTDLSASRTMPKLASASPLDSAKQGAVLRRSRSVGYNSRDLRRLTREQMMHDANTHPSPKSVQLEFEPMAELNSGGQARGLGIEMVEAPARRSSNGSGSATPSTIVGVAARHAIAA